jgi:hypothetical protein
MTELSLVFLSPSRKIQGQYLTVNHGHFLPHPPTYCCITYAVEEVSLSKLRSRTQTSGTVSTKSNLNLQRMNRITVLRDK